MRQQSFDPEVRRYDMPEETPCPECKTWMLPLEKYEIQKSESASLDAEWWEFLLWGWWAFVYNYIYDTFTMEGRKKKLAELKATCNGVDPVRDLRG